METLDAHNKKDIGWHDSGEWVSRDDVIATQEIRIERAEKTITRLKKFLYDYLTIHGLEDKMSKRANEELKYE